MEQSRLRINDKEVGLRNLGNGLFEPKNLQILNDVVNDNVNLDCNPTEFLRGRLPPKKEPDKYHKIESFCFVATENIKEEAELLIRSLRQFHSEPIYLICDKGTLGHLKKLNLLEGVTLKIHASEDALEAINDKHFKNHNCIANNIHNPPAIFKKMDVMNLALKSHSNTFFLDSDIIVLDNLQEYYTADVVLSPHYYPNDSSHKGFEFGFYNAGYVFCANKGFPKFWKHLYLNDSTFFEQECMNRIPDRYRVQTFGKEHNVGFWRGAHLPHKAKSIHTHITSGVDKNRSKKLIELNGKIKDYALEQTRNNCKTQSHIRKYYSPEINQKLAFIHYGKSAGVYVQTYLRMHVMPNVGHFNSWWDFSETNTRKLYRDWTKEELLEIAATTTESGLAHNHHVSWCSKTVKSFNDNGWLTFMFVRDPRDTLCSLFFWSKNQRKKFEHKNGDEALLAHPLKEEILKMSGKNDADKVSLDEFVNFFSKSESGDLLWKLPDYTDQKQQVAEFSDVNFGIFFH